MTDGTEAAIAIGTMNIVALIVSRLLSWTENRSTRGQMNAIHTLVNSNFGNQLTISAKALRRIADMSGDTRDIVIATEAERLLNEHLSKQSMVDSRVNPPVAKS